MTDNYRTIEKAVEDVIFKELGSKFINFAYPVENEDDIRIYLDQLREIYPDANHHCYAYALGIDGKNHRANDDGEPSGSAGLPIYNQILSSEITNILIVSVRYFGGTKLGIPGLVKAYKYAAQVVLEEANIVEKFVSKRVKMVFSYDQQGIVERNVDRISGEIKDKHFSDKCMFIISVRESKLDEFIRMFDEYYQMEIKIID
ncbi:YigZ family protein [Empedobacter tilapiae]|uniref:YigZ family protein n=1 Tax=Empedobacter tilapiae TaxID=2491114 RepID=A0A4Z1BG20_9FLAO|nr:YigZ family protein [Empedobacter tilapiae]TGN27864.1 YigZ family protein [Empedobacter tilapiae]